MCKCGVCDAKNYYLWKLSLWPIGGSATPYTPMLFAMPLAIMLSDCCHFFLSKCRVCVAKHLNWKIVSQKGTENLGNEQ